MSYSVKVNQENLQFEIEKDDQKAFMEFRINEGNIYLMHTKVPEELQGKGMGGSLVEFALNYAKENDLQPVVYCPFAKAYLRKKRAKE